MLKTCTRCRSRRIKCDAQLPACRNCHKAGLPCSFYDHVLKEDVPRSYIKSLRDRVDELTAVLAAHQRSETAAAAAALDPSLTPANRFCYELPTRSTAETLELGAVAPVVLGDCTVRKLLQLGVSVGVGMPGNEWLEADEINDLDDENFTSPLPSSPHHHAPASAASNASVSTAVTPAPPTVRLLLAHYTRCIEPAFPLGLVFAASHRDAAHSLRHLSDPRDRCQALLACAIAAAHKSYHAAAWRSVARACRAAAADLAAPLLARPRPDDQTVLLLLLLALYELADPARGRLHEYLDIATRTVLELGWHRESPCKEDAHDSIAVSSPTKKTSSSSALLPHTRHATLTALVDIERILGVLAHRPPLLADSLPPIHSDADRAHRGYHQLLDLLFRSHNAPARLAQRAPVCPATVEPLTHAVALLRSLPPDQPATNEAWLLLHPLLADHTPCLACAPVDNVLSGLPDLADLHPPHGLHARVTHEACRLAERAHTILATPDVFLPPVLAAYRAFMAGCVLVTAMAAGWVVPATHHTRALLQCSEVLAFVAPCWRGGRDYYDVFRQISKGLE